MEKNVISFPIPWDIVVECLAQGTDTRLVGKNANIRKYPLEQIQIFAYHSDISTTQSYLKDHSDDTINEMFGFSE